MDWFNLKAQLQELTRSFIGKSMVSGLEKTQPIHGWIDPIKAMTKNPLGFTNVAIVEFVDLPRKHMVIFHGCVSLPEGVCVVG